MRRAVLPLGLLCAACATEKPATPTPPVSAAIPMARATLEAVMARHRLVGLSAAVAIGGEVVWKEGFGLADAEAGRPMSPATQLRLGSVSKVVTAALVGRLVEQGKLDLDAPIERALGDVPPAWRGITARQLAGHLAGIRHYDFRDLATPMRRYTSVRESLERFRADPLVAPPGQRYHYSTYGFTLLSSVLEVAGGAPFLELLDREVTRPLGLASMVGDDATVEKPRLTRFYDVPSGERRPARQHDSSFKWAGGGLVATAEDLARFAAAHRPGGGYLRPETLELLFRPQATGETPTGVGIAWRVSRDGAGRRRVGHAGNMDGCRAMVLLYPEDGVAVALLSNVTGKPEAVETVAFAVAAPFLLDVERERNPR